ncbi:hypothetical protein [Halostella salina]|uniref:hypothetical protein n=1 Tax=Halostella salina TaxID=1547897 RepID=UPI00196A16FD|nr:hypothetical protein [Halostella salina]
MDRQTRPTGVADAERFGRRGGPRALVAELRGRNFPLFAVAALNAVLFVGFVAGIAADPRTVGGEPVWLKPAKFAGSIALFTATLGWLSRHLPVKDATLRRASIGIAAGGVIEILLIGGQAARGVESHFNQSTALDTAVFAVMGATIAVTVGLVALLLVRARRAEFDTHPAFAKGIRLGVALFVVGSYEGGAMVALGGSAVGAAPTLPVVGWHLIGDFRMAHFVGLHALQTVPLAGFLAAVGAERGYVRRPSRVVTLVATAVAAALVLTFALALVPLVA